MKLEDVMTKYSRDFHVLETPDSEVRSLVKQGEKGIENYLAGRYLDRAVSGFMSGVAATGLSSGLTYWAYNKAASIDPGTFDRQGFLCLTAALGLVSVGALVKLVGGSFVDFGRYLKHKKAAGEQDGN